MTKEYSIQAQAGTYNMKEQRSFFASKILEIEDEMYIGNTNLNWTQSSNRTQGIRLEDVNNSFITETIKNNNHTMVVSEQQSLQDKREFTKWELNINVKEIVTEYLFAQLKSNRTFEGIDNNKTLYNNVDLAIKQYITDNIYPRIRFYNIVLYIKYYKIGEQYLEDNVPIIALQYDTKFKEKMITTVPLSGESTEQYSIRALKFKESITVKNFQLSIDPNQLVANVIYKQTESSLNYKFDYYFDVIWNKA